MNDIVFRPVSLVDKAVIDAHNRGLPPYADWAFGTLLAWWDYYGDLTYTFHRGNLLIRSSYLSFGAEQRITLVGRNDVNATIDDVFDFQRRREEAQLLAATPAYAVHAIGSSYEVDEDIDNAEYVLCAQGHAYLEGAAYSRIRSVVKKFEQSHPSISVEAPSLADPASRESLIEAIDSFAQVRNNDVDGSNRTVILRTLPIATAIGLECFCVSIGGHTRAVALYKRIGENSINLNHLKIDESFNNLFRYTIHRLARHVSSQGIRHLNIEQDLGIPGLRECKRRLRPVELLRKYNLRPIGSNVAEQSKSCDSPRSSWT